MSIESRDQHASTKGQRNHLPYSGIPLRATGKQRPEDLKPLGPQRDAAAGGRRELIYNDEDQRHFSTDNSEEFPAHSL